LLVLLATSLLLLGISETPTLIPGEEETSPIAKLRPQVSLFIGYAVPVRYLLPDRCPTGTRMGKNLYPRQLTGTETG